MENKRRDRFRWPVGNRLDMCINLRQITVTDGGTQFGDYIPSAAAVVKVWLVGNYASFEYDPRIDGSKLYITDNGELKVGVYAIDVRVQEPERKLRSFRCGELEIVRETKQLALGDFVLDNNITLDADAFIFGEGPSAFEVAVRDGYTGTKAEWLESLRGREGRGIADIVALPTGAFRILLTDGSAYVTPILKGEAGVSIVDISVTGITTMEVLCTVTMSDGTTHQLNLPRGEQGAKGDKGDDGQDGRGIQSVQMNNDYTITFSYTDGTSYTTPQALRGEKGEDGQDGQDGRGISSMALDDDNHLIVSYSDGTSYTTPQSLQGERGVSITDFEQVGESATMCFFNIYFSNGNISQIGLPKGEQGDRGEQGPQGPKGDTVVLGEVGEYKLYNIGGTATDGAMTQDATTKAIAANTGYYECSTASGTAAKVAVGDNEALYTLQKGGSIKVKMTNANAAASGVTLKIGSSAATPLYYNGEAVSASNTWEAGEVVEVYYDGTEYQATNAKVGSGNAADMKYDNAQSGLVADNVQGAVDEVVDELQAEEEKLFESIKESYVVNSLGIWTSNTSNHILVKVNGGDRIRVTANANANAQLRWFTEYAAPSNGNPAPVTSTGATINIAAGESSILTAPSNAQYLYALGTQSGADHTPTSYTRIKYAKEVLEDVSDKVDDLSVAVYGNINCQFSRNFGINSGGTWTNSSITHYIIKAHEGMSLKVTANADNYALLYWLKNSNNPVVKQKAPISDIDPSKYMIDAGGSLIVTAPSDAQYLFVYGTNGNTVYTPSKIELVLENKVEKSILEKQLVKQDIVAAFPMGIVASGTSYIWINNTGYNHTEIEVEPGDLVEFVTTGLFTQVYFLKEHVNPTAGDSALVSDIAYYRSVPPVGETTRFIVPEDSHILYLGASGADFSSTTVKVSGKESFEGAGITKGVECDLGWASGTIFGYNAKKYLGKEILVAVDNAAEDVVELMLRGVTGTGISTIRVYLRGGYGSVTIPDNEDIHYIYIPHVYGQSYIIDKDSLTDTILRTGNKYKESLATSILAQGKCISPAEYLYAFGAYNWYYDNKIWTLYSANLALDADETTVRSDAVTTEYSLYDGTTENHVMAIANAVDQNGNAVTPFTHCYNGLAFLTLDNKVGYWTLFGNASNKNYNFGYNTDLDIDSLENTITRARLTYNDTTVEFTINNYRQMLYALGLTSSYKESGMIYQDNTCIVVDRDNNCYYVILCSAQGATGTNIAFPIVLLKSYDLKLWEYVGALDNGTAFSAYEMQAVIKNEKLYLVYRHQPAPEGFGCVVANISDLSTIFKREWSVGCVLSRPCCFDVNGEVYITFNTNPCVFAIMDEVNQDRWARRSQQSVFKFVDDIPVFQFNIANPVGFNYPWFCKVTYEPYYDCTNEGSDTALTATIPHYALNIAVFGKGVQIRMIHKHTAGAATLNISNTGAKELYYNNAAVSSSNTWDDGEVLDVFYNKSTGRYMATPADTTPRYGTESLYVSWSEDRRYLYRRQLANVSIANITPVFTRE